MWEQVTGGRKSCVRNAYSVLCLLQHWEDPPGIALKFLVFSWYHHQLDFYLILLA